MVFAAVKVGSPPPPPEFRGRVSAGVAVARRIASFARGLLALAALFAGAPALAQSAAITASSPATLNQGNLRGATISVTLTSATYQSTVAASHFTLTTTIPGLTVHSVGLNTGSTVATLRLHYDGSDFNTAATIAVTVAAAGTSHNSALTTSTQAVGPARWVNVSTKAVALTEGGTGTYTVTLESPPTGNVTVTVTSDHTAAVTRSPNTLTFTTTTWSTPQTVTLTAVADNTDTVDEVALVTNVATGGGYADNATANRTVRATVADDDARTGTDYDTDDDGLIEISNHAQLNAVQWDLDGNGSSLNSGYSTGSTSAFPSPAAGMGCPDTSDSNQTGNCTGYELLADIDLDTDGDGMADSGDAYWRSGKGWDPLGDQAKKTSSPFTATLRGNGHSISNLYSRDEFPSTGAGFGFFATIRFARIESLALLDVDIGDGSGSGSPGDLAGTLAASIESSTLAGVYVTGSVTPHSTGTTPTGGLAGNCGGATIQNTYTNVAIGYGYNVAGFIGESTNATDSQSGAGDNMTFGACEIYNSFAVGSVSGSGTRSSTRVSSDGGLVAEPPQPSTTYITSRDAYWDTQTTGKSSSSGSPNSDGKTTAQLKGPTAATGIFAFWDDYDTDGDGRVDADDAAWDFGTSTEYPVLTWGGHTAVGQLGPRRQHRPLLRHGIRHRPDVRHQHPHHRVRGARRHGRRGHHHLHRLQPAGRPRLRRHRHGHARLHGQRGAGDLRHAHHGHHGPDGHHHRAGRGHRQDRHRPRHADVRRHRERPPVLRFRLRHRQDLHRCVPHHGVPSAGRERRQRHDHLHGVRPADGPHL